jgi:hypothetical protein
MSDNRDEFERLYMGTFAIGGREHTAYDLVACYEFLAESFDRRVCTGGLLNGAAIPVGPDERYLVNANARRLDEKLTAAAKELKVLDEVQHQRKRGVHRDHEDNRRAAYASGLLRHFGL